MSDINSHKLLQGIESAFSDSIYPGDENLVYDNSDMYPDVIETKESFRGKHWKNLSIDIINRHRKDLPAFTPKAFCFYLPAFLVACISYPRKITDVLPDNLIFTLTPHNPESDAVLNMVVDILTPEQKKVVINFLKWYTNSMPEEIRGFHPNLERATKFWQEITS